jgi:hypothetical protein
MFQQRRSEWVGVEHADHRDVNSVEKDFSIALDTGTTRRGCTPR